MLMYEYPADESDERRAHAAALKGAVELFEREDSGGGLILRDNGKVNGASIERQVELLFAGGTYGERGGEWLFCVALWTPRDFRAEFVAWYECEHMPILLESPIWGGCRFVEQQVADGCQFFALHQLASKSALDSQERKRSRSTPWFHRLAKNAWFDGAFSRVLYRRV